MDLFAICLGDEHDCELLAYFGESLVSVLEVVDRCGLGQGSQINVVSLRGLKNVLMHNRHGSGIDSRRISHDKHLCHLKPCSPSKPEDSFHLLTWHAGLYNRLTVNDGAFHHQCTALNILGPRSTTNVIDTSPQFDIHSRIKVCIT